MRPRVLGKASGNRRPQIGAAEGLGQSAVGTKLDGGLEVVGTEPTPMHGDQSRGPGAAAIGSEHFEPVGMRHDDVGENDVGTLRGEPVLALAPIMRLANPMHVLGEQPGDRPPHRGLGFNEQYECHSRPESPCDDVEN